VPKLRWLPPPRPGRPGPGYWEQRFTKIRDEIERNRRGQFRLSTWVLALILLALVAAVVAIVVFTPGYS
jgi:hypothetical protein